MTCKFQVPNCGCMYPAADNYNMWATEDDGSCTFACTLVPPPVPGCTYPAADNFDENATEDDGSCTCAYFRPLCPH